MLTVQGIWLNQLQLNEFKWMYNVNIYYHYNSLIPYKIPLSVMINRPILLNCKGLELAVKLLF